MMHTLDLLPVFRCLLLILFDGVLGVKLEDLAPMHHLVDLSAILVNLLVSVFKVDVEQEV